MLQVHVAALGSVRKVTDAQDVRLVSLKEDQDRDTFQRGVGMWKRNRQECTRSTRAVMVVCWTKPACMSTYACNQASMKALAWHNNNQSVLVSTACKSNLVRNCVVDSFLENISRLKHASPT